MNADMVPKSMVEELKEEEGKEKPNERKITRLTKEIDRLGGEISKCTDKLAEFPVGPAPGTVRARVMRERWSPVPRITCSPASSRFSRALGSSRVFFVRAPGSRRPVLSLTWSHRYTCLGVVVLCGPGPPVVLVAHPARRPRLPLLHSLSPVLLYLPAHR